MLIKYLILIGRTFIATFFTVNFFNIIPLNLNNNAWFTQVSMLIVDTASLLLLGLICMKLSSVYLINNYQNKEYFDDYIQDTNLIVREEKNIGKINKISRYLVILFVSLAFFQSYLFFNGIKLINYEYSANYENINKKFNLQKTKLENEFLDKSLKFENIKNDKLNSLEMKKNNYIVELDKSISTARFFLFRGVIKVFIMSFIWAYGLFKLSRFKTN